MTILAERQASVRGRLAICDEFLAPAELRSVMRFAEARATAFQRSTVLTPTPEQERINPQYRRSRVLLDLGEARAALEARLRESFSWVLDALAVRPFALSKVEIQLTSSEDGDFFRRHVDNRHWAVSGRRLAFVHFIHVEPKRFSGGELCLYGAWPFAGERMRITPRQNMVVFFPAGVDHEVLPVRGRARSLGETRLTMNGWFHGSAR
jgi:Rps23 Pro-64 3,4-dihydroxylase Tpa1-like proline 4-hydroxylase